MQDPFILNSDARSIYIEFILKAIIVYSIFAIVLNNAIQ